MDSNLFADLQRTTVRVQILFVYCLSRCQTSDHDCTSPAEQHIIQALQQNDGGEYPKLYCRTTDQMIPVRTAAEVCKNRASPSIDGHDAIYLRTVSSATMPNNASRSTAIKVNMAEPPEPIPFPKRLLRQLDVLCKQPDANLKFVPICYECKFDIPVYTRCHFTLDSTSWLTDQRRRWLNQHIWQACCWQNYFKRPSVGLNWHAQRQIP